MKMEQFNRENNTAEQSVRTVSQKYANKGKLRRVIALLSAVVVFFTMNTLKFEADTLEHYAMCGFEAHVHDETCLDENGQVVCGMDEHIHTDACFQQRPVKPEPTVLDEYVPLNTQVVLSSPMDALDAPVEEVSVSLGDDEGEAYDDGVLDVTYDEPAIPEIHEYRMDGEVAFLSDVLNGVGMSVSNITSVGEIIDDSILVEGDDFTVESAEDIPGEYIIRAVRDFDRAELGIVDDAGVESIWLLNGIGVAPTQPVEAAATEEDIIYEETAAEASETAAADDGIETEEQQPVEEAVTETQEPAIEEALQETEAELEESPADDVTEAENETVENVSEENVTENTEEPEIEETADEAVTDGEPADEAETGLDEAETENTEATEAENTEVTGAENTEVTETENNEVTEVENTEATEEENTEATETENTEVTEAENTEAIETESVETDETEVEDAAQEAEIAETETEIEDQAVRSVALDFTNYIATDDHAVYLYDAANAFVLVNAAEITSADGVETVTEEEIAASEDATLVITGDGEYELDGVIYTVSGLVLPEKVVTNAEQNVTIATANDESTLLNVEPVFEESAEGYADIFSLFQAAEADPTLLSRLSDALFGVAYAEEVRELQMKLFNIGLQSTEDGSEVEPGTAVRVTTFFDAIEGVDFALYHIVDNQPVLVENAVVVEDGRAIGFDFEIDSLSPFALVYYTVTTREGETFTGYSLKTDEKALNAQQLLETLGVQAIATGVTCNDESVAIDGLDIALPESFEKIALTIEAGVDKYEITLLTGDELTAAVGDYAVSLDLSNAGLDDSASYKVEITQQPATDEEVAAVEAALSETLEDGTRKIAHVSDLEMVDISIINTETGLAVEPQGSVAVSLTRGGEAIPTVVHFRNDGEVETLPVENGTFTTDSFSAFTGSYTVEYTTDNNEVTVNLDFTDIVKNGVDFDTNSVITALNDGVSVSIPQLEAGYVNGTDSVANGELYIDYTTADNKNENIKNVNWIGFNVVSADEGLTVADGKIRVTKDGTVVLSDGISTINIVISNYTRLVAEELSASGVDIEVIEGSVPAGSTATYTALDGEKTSELVSTYINNEEGVEYTAFDVSIAMPEGGEFKEEGSYKVTVDHEIELPDGVDEKAVEYKLYHIHDGAVEELPVAVENGQITFTTNSFSEFILTYTIGTSDDYIAITYKTERQSFSAEEVFANVIENSEIASVVSESERLTVEGNEVSLSDDFQHGTIAIELANGDKYRVTVIKEGPLFAELDGYKITINFGDTLPEGNYKVAVEQVEATQDQVEEMQAALSEHLENGVRREAHVGNVELLDISIINLDTNESVEPQGSVRVTLEKDGVELPTVFHFRRDGVMEALEVSENSFVTESFSAFTSNYTVDFEYSGMRISISGNSTYALSDVLKWFNIEGNVDNASLTLIDGEGVGLALSDDCLSLSSDKPFQDVYQLDITVGDSVYHFYVTDAVSMNNVLDHLTLNFNGRTITVDKSGNVTGLSAGEQLTIRNGTQFSLDILFKEISGNENAQFASEMTYQLPGGLDASGYSQEFEIDFGDEGSISGNTISVSSTGLISITLNTNDPNYHLINDVGNAQIKVKIAGSMNGTDLVFHGESDTTVNVTPDESHDTSVSKSAEYKDGRMYYTITASSTGVSQNVVITDKFTGELIKLDDDSNFTITSNKKDTVTNTLTKDSDNKGFKVEIPSMEHQETITIKYSAAIDPLPADGILHPSDVGNGVKIKADSDPENPTPVTPTNFNNDIDLSSFWKKYISTTGDNGIFTKEDGYEYKTVTWEVTSNPEHVISLAKGSTITDTIKTNPDGRMAYSGTGVVVYVSDGTGDEVARTLTWGQDNADGKLVKSGNTWTYTIPEGDAGKKYSYRIVYTTDVKITGMLDLEKFNNHSEGPNGEGDQWVDVGPRGEDRFNTGKKVNSVNGDEVEWVIETNVPKTGYNTFEIVEKLPSWYLDNQMYYDTYVNNSVRVMKADGTELTNFTVDSTSTTGQVTITFSGNPAIPAADSNYMLYVYLKTKSNPSLENKANAKNGDAVLHKNNVDVTVDGKTKSTSSQIDLTSDGMDKLNSVGISDIDMKDGTIRKLYKFTIIITGIDENTQFPVTINDYFNTDALEYLDPSKTLNSVSEWQGKVYGGNSASSFWDYNSNQATAVPMTGENKGVVLTLPENLFPKRSVDYAEDLFYSFYKLEYYLISKTNIADLALENGNGKLDLSNKIDGDDEVDFSYEYPGVTKEMVGLDERKGIATFRIVVNPDQATMNAGEPMTLVDEYLNTISIDYETIQFATEPAGMDVSYDAQSWNPAYDQDDPKQSSEFKDYSYIIFTVPDETKVTITYTGHVTETGNVHILNNATMKTYFNSKVDHWKNIGGNTSGSGTVVRIRLMKYESGNMRNTLAGVRFALFNADKYNELNDDEKAAIMADLKTNGQESNYVSHATTEVNTKPVMKVFTTGDNGFVQVTMNQRLDGTDLIIGQKYILREIDPPKGFEIDDTPYEFTISEGKNTEYSGYVYRNNDVLNVKNKPKAGLKLVKYVRDALLSDTDKEKIIFKLYVNKGTDSTPEWQPYIPDGKTEAVQFTYAEFVNNIYFVSDLPVGSYRVVEVNEKIGGYDLKTTDVKVDSNATTTISESESVHLTVDDSSTRGSDSPIYGDFKVLDADQQAGTVHTVTMTNKYDSSKIKLLKIDDHGAYLAGAKFEMTKEGVSGTYATLEINETNKNTGVTVQGLTAGNYTIVETEAPEGHVAINEPINFTVGEDGKIAYTTPDGEKQGYVAWDFASDSETIMVFTVTNEKNPEETILNVRKKWVDLQGNDITEEMTEGEVTVRITRKAYMDPVVVDMSLTGNSGTIEEKGIAGMNSNVIVTLYNVNGFDTPDAPAPNETMPELTFAYADGTKIVPTITVSEAPEPAGSRGCYYTYTLSEVTGDVTVTGALNWDDNDYKASISTTAVPARQEDSGFITLSYNTTDGTQAHWSNNSDSLVMLGSEAVNGVRRPFGYSYSLEEISGAMPLESSHNIDVIDGVVSFTNQKNSTDLKLVKKWEDEAGTDITSTYAGKNSVSGTLYQVAWPEGSQQEKYYTVSVWAGGYGISDLIETRSVKAGETVEVTMASTYTIGNAPRSWVPSSNYDNGAAISDWERTNDDKTLTYRYIVNSDICIGALSANNNYAETTTTIVWPTSTAKNGEPYQDPEKGIVDGRITVNKTESGENAWTKTIKELPLFTDTGSGLVYYTYYFVEDGIEKFVTSYIPSVTEDGRSRAVNDGTIQVVNRKDTTAIQVEKVWKNSAGETIQPDDINEISFRVYQYASALEDLSTNDTDARVDLKVWNSAAKDDDLLKEDYDIITKDSTARVVMTLDKSANPDLRVYAQGGSYASGTTTAYTRREELPGGKLVYTWELPISDSTEIGCCINQVSDAASVEASLTCAGSVLTVLPETYKVVKSGDTWQITNVTDLDKTGVVGGNTVYYAYMIKENGLNGYLTTYENNQGIKEGKVTITNTKDSEKTDIEVQKKWFKENGDPDPSMEDVEGSIEFEIYRKATVAETIEGHVKNDSKFVIQGTTNMNQQSETNSVLQGANLGKTLKITFVYNEGYPVTMPILTMNITGQDSKKITVSEVKTNASNQQVLSYLIPLTKSMDGIYVEIIHHENYPGIGDTWELPNKDQLVNSTVEVTDDPISEYVGTYTLDSSNNWDVLLKGLDTEGVYDGMKVSYTYYVEETSVNVAGKYNATYENNDGIAGTVTLTTDDDKIVINNTEVHEETTELEVDKKWFYNTTEMTDKKGSITFQLRQIAAPDPSEDVIIVNNPGQPATITITQGQQTETYKQPFTITNYGSGEAIKTGDKVRIEFTNDWAGNVDKQKSSGIVFTDTPNNYPGYVAGIVTDVDATIFIYWNSNTPRTATKDPTYTYVPPKPEGEGIPYNAATRQEDESKTYTLSSDTATPWFYKFTKLPTVNAAGRSVTYTVKEVDVPSGYTSTVSEVVNNKVTITNTTTEPPKTSVKVQKKWTTAWPEGTEVQFTLKGNNVQVTLPESSAQENPHYVSSTEVYEWEGLPEFVEGTTTPIVYTVEETAVKVGTTVYTGADIAKYWTTQSETRDGVTIFTNTPNKGSLTVEKKISVNGTDVTDNETLNDVTFLFTVQPEGDATRYVTSQTTGEISTSRTTFELKPGTANKLTFENLPVGRYVVTETYEDGTIVGNYRFSAATSTRTQTVEVLKDASGEAVLVNDYGPNTTSVTVTKEWFKKDGTTLATNNPNVTIYFNLYKDGAAEPINAQPYTLPDGTSWSRTISELDPGTYTVKEVSQDGNTVIANGENSATDTTRPIIVKNTLTDFEAEKIWNDLSQTVTHPAITFHLNQKVGSGAPAKMAASYDKQIAAGAAGNALKVKWDELPAYDYATGEAITYSVTEDVVNNYTTEIVDGQVTNTLKTGNLKLSKTAVGTGAPDEEFTFNVTLTAPSGVTFGSNFATVRTGNGAGNGTQAVTSGTSFEVKLHGGDTWQINGLPVGTRYAVVEGELPVGWTKTSIIGASGAINENGVTVEAKIENTYSEVTEAPQATKNLTGRAWGDAETFIFNIEADDSYGEKVVMNDDKTATATKAQKTATFKNITFKDEGTYYFTIKEQHSGEKINGVTYSQKEVKVKVVVTKTDGVLSAEMTYTDVKDDAGQAATESYGNDAKVFTNTYDTSTTAQIKGTKVMSDSSTPGTYRFNIEAKEPANAPLPKDGTSDVTQVTNIAANFEFPSITYPLSLFESVVADGNGVKTLTFKYNVTEDHSGLTAAADGSFIDASHVKYDTSTVEVTVNVTYNTQTGKMSVDVTPAQANLKFTNEQLGELKITKNVQKNGNNEGTGTFYYGVYASTDVEDGTPKADTTAVRTGSIQVTANGTATVTETDLSYGTYYVYELDGENGTPIVSGNDGVKKVINDTVYTVTGSGTTAVIDSTTPATAVLTNNKETVDIPVDKKWVFAQNSNAKPEDIDANDSTIGQWPQGVSVTVELYRAEGTGEAAATGNTVTLTKAKPSDTFTDLPKYKDVETEYKYSVVEASVSGVASGLFTTAVSQEGQRYVITNNEKEAGLTIIKSFTGATLTEDEKKQITFTVTGEGLASGGVTKTYADFVDGKWTLTQTDGIQAGKTYTVVESKADIGKYIRTTTIKVNDVDTPISGETITADVLVATNTMIGTIVVTNDYTKEKTSISGTKTWVDSRTHNNASEITLKLYRKVEGAEDSTYVEVPSTDYTFAWNGNTYTFSGLDKYVSNDDDPTTMDDEKEYVYKVEETSVNVTEKVNEGTEHEETITITYKSSTSGTNFTNTELTSISKTKAWAGGTWPAETTVTFTLSARVAGVDSYTIVDANGTELTTSDLSKDATSTSSTVTWSNLPKYTLVGEAGSEQPVEIVYTVTESSVTVGTGAGATTYSDAATIADHWTSAEDGNTITNTPSTTQVTGTKTWITNGTPVGTPTVKLFQKPVNEAGDATIVKAAAGTPTVYGSATGADTDVDLQPTWEGNTYTFAGLRKYTDDQVLYEYTVVETEFKVNIGGTEYTYTVENGTVTAPEGAPSFVVSSNGNNLTNKEVTTASVTKAWEGAVDESKIVSINYRLTRKIGTVEDATFNSDAANTVTIEKAETGTTDWGKTWDNLDAYGIITYTPNGGSETTESGAFVYNVDETQFVVKWGDDDSTRATYTVTKSGDTYTVMNPSGDNHFWKATKSGTAFTNTLDETYLDVIKLWSLNGAPATADTDDDIDEISFYLYRSDNKVIDSATKQAKDYKKDTEHTDGAEPFTITRDGTKGSGEWKLQIAGLEKTDSSGTPYTYWIQEVTVPGYSTTPSITMVSGGNTVNVGPGEGKQTAPAESTITITNSKYSVSLPSTGGPGTTGFYVLGSILTLLALVLLVTKKRSDGAGIE